MIHRARFADGLDRICDLGGVRAAVFAAWAFAWCVPLFPSAGALNEFRDAHVLVQYEEVAVRTVRDHRELPLWDPYYCGGVDLLGSPQTRHAAPTFLLSLLFGARRAGPLVAFAMLMLGMEGFFRYARSRTRGGFGPAIVAPLFAGSGFFASSFFMGWVNFLGFTLMPWVLAGVTRAVRGDRSGIAYIALATSFMIGFGGTYAAPMTAIFATCELARSIVERGPRHRETWNGAGLAALGAFLAAAVAAVRLWPIAETLGHSNRIMAGAPHHSLEQLARMAFEQSAPSGGNPHLPGILFFGVCAAALAPFGLFGRRAIYPLVLAILSVATAMGYEIDGGPFVRLRDLPLFEGFRYPFRFLFPAGLFLLELGAFGGDALLSGLRRHVGAALPFALFLALVAGGLVQQWRNVDATIAGMPLAPVPRRVPNDFRQSRGSRRALLHYTAQNLGAIQCWEAYPVAMSPLLRGDLPQEEYFADPADGTVERRAWSPNRIALRVHANRAARVLINQNWHPGWRASHGRVVSHEGLLAVDVPPGDHAVVVRYLPRSALGGALVSLAGLAGLLLVARRRAPTRRALGTSLLLPPMALLAALAIPEPPWPRPPLRNANRELIVLDALPRGAIPVDVRFDLPVRIVGYEPPRAADPTETWPIRLYFHVEGDVPRSVGIFVHVITPRGRLVSLDHEVVGASVFLADAPKGKVLRDATAMLPGGPGGYRLRVGLWHASGDRSRIPIRDSGGLPTEDDWVELGVFGAPPR